MTKLHLITFNDCAMNLCLDFLGRYDYSTENQYTNIYYK